jgi:hypothetical protein
VDSLDEVTPAASAFRRPADYYSSVDTQKPIFARWVPFGCGTASIVVIVAMLIMAAGISSGAFGELFEYVFASMEGEIVKMMAPDVKPEQKKAFQAEMKTMRESIRRGKLSMDRLQPLMKSIREASVDEKVTGPEVERLTREVHTINSQPRK